MIAYKKVIQKMLVVLFLLFAVLIGTKIYQYRNYYNGVRDIISHVIFFFTDATEWAPNYSEDVFKKIHSGLSQEEVLKLLGKPLEEEKYIDREIWRYTRAPIDSNYWFRIIVFDNKRIVMYTEREYFVD
jgi:steroid 5-alpha reductase family enzyme